MDEMEDLRESGVLSDVCVVVDEKEFNLHRFPLFVKSEFFKQHPDLGDTFKNSRISLDNFPGGSEIFGQIADYCYNKNLLLTSSNVTVLRCAADYLKMFGPTNLIAATERFINGAMDDAKRMRSVVDIVKLIVNVEHSKHDVACTTTGELSEKLFSALLDVWIHSHTLRYAQVMNQKDKNLDAIIELPFEWIVKLLDYCFRNRVNTKLATSIVFAYVNIVLLLDVDGAGDSNSAVAEVSDTDEEVAAVTNHENNKSVNPQIIAAAHKFGKLGVMKKLFNTIDDIRLIADLATPSWLIGCLKIVDEGDCDENIEHDLKYLAGLVLHRFTSADIRQLGWSRFCDIIGEVVVGSRTNSRKGDDHYSMGLTEPDTTVDVLIATLDMHMTTLAKDGELTMDEFTKLIKSIPAELRPNYDRVFDVLEILLSRETVEDEKLQDILNVFDLTRCHEKTLRRAMEQNLLPMRAICEAALDLADRLRACQKREPSPTKQSGEDRSSPIHAHLVKRPGPSPTWRSRPTIGINRAATTIRRDDLTNTTQRPTSVKNSAYVLDDNIHETKPSRRTNDYFGAGGGDDDALRMELKRISASYDDYFRDKYGNARERTLLSPLRRSAYSRSTENDQYSSSYNSIDRRGFYHHT